MSLDVRGMAATGDAMSIVKEFKPPCLIRRQSGVGKYLTEVFGMPRWDLVSVQSRQEM